MNPTTIQTLTLNNPLTHQALILAAIIFTIGLIGVLKRRNIIFVLMSIEVMLNAAALAFIAAGHKSGSLEGEIMYIFVITVAAAEVAVGLALVLKVFQKVKTLDIDILSRLKG